MSLPIHDYAMIGDMRTAALVGRSGSIDWLCLPRFDSGACFASLLGDPRHGRWLLQPAGGLTRTARRYREDTLVLETDLTTAHGTVRVVDCMPPHESIPHVVRVVEGIEGEVPVRMELIIRFDYGSIVPWVRTVDGAVRAVAGPDALVLRTPVETHGEGLTTVAEFTVRRGQRVPFVLGWHPSSQPPPAPFDAEGATFAAAQWWRNWTSRCTYQGPWRDAVVRSLITLKGLTYAPTGGMVAAVTTSLPEQLGGVRNWDYRYAWVRDATFTLYALHLGGFREEAAAWRDWLLRTVAGSPRQLQILYGVAGERRLPEIVLDWLPGYAGSVPVRAGNSACDQRQLDVFGEVMDAMHQARRAGIPADPTAWELQRQLLEFLESRWHEPDEGLWESRGPKQHFTHSKVMSWVAFDRAVKAVERTGEAGPVERWREIRDDIHREVCTRAWDPARRTFTRAYGSPELDGALLIMPLVGFLPRKDPRMTGTVEAIQRELMHEGFLLRYRTSESADGMPPGEGAFLLCTFWLADNLAMMGREAEARELFERLLSVRNDVGLLAEEYDPVTRQLLGNFPQAFSHVGLVNTAFNLTPRQPSPARERER